MAFSTSILAVFISLVALSVYSHLKSKQKVPQGAKLPPGPAGKPLIGNLLDIPPAHSWLRFKEWADQYGPLFRLSLAGREHYVVSTEKVANALLRERGNIYSSREQLPAAVKLLGDSLRPLFYPHDDTFRQSRRLMHRLCKEGAAITYQSTQILESTRLLYDLIRNPEDYEGWLMRYSSGLIFRVGFGKVMKDNDDPLLKRLFAENHQLERVASPGAYLVDTFPILMNLPDWLAPFKRELKALHVEEQDIFFGLHEDVRREVQQGTAPDCWQKTYIEHAEEYKLTTAHGAYVVGTLFEAGAGTTAAAMMSWLLCMALHPDELRKLQQQLDEVVGNDRLPTFDDLPNLPRVRAVAKETLRWRPVTAGGVPHLSEKDDVYDGMFIPAGTNVHANQWAIHREEALYPDPETFKPDRWLEPKYPTYREPLTQYPNLQNYSSFGFGRRICPGMHIAERSLNILVARIAWACDIKKKTGSDGKQVEVPLYDYVSGFNVQPKWFAFDLSARSEERWQVVKEAYEWEMEHDPLKDRRGW
ncbi:hypothetical protein LTR36_002801 [Oleoguttula mirabilis]|uniref:Cytochrome P450 n=1 Tax=Oleoguttula mirabilis TaxID=1507867 RepID=A0AAV9JJU5_9PEZI|nr:hypothetical protein LTR36_002801 [Oleoguttula mirabilis]